VSTVRRPSADDEFVAGLLARCTFPAVGSAVTLGVSGGADSTALLALAVAGGLNITAVHVDHGLREGSENEAVLVASLCSEWGAKFESVRCVVELGSDLEARARDARHSLLPPGALLGHTAEDQAETVIVRLLRGTGPSGIAAMRADRHPILGLRRSETEALCAHLGVEPFEDPTNRDPRFVRNRVRYEVLPLLSDVAQRDVVPLLARLAALSGEQADVIGELATSVDPTDANAVAAAPAPIASVALRRWWSETTLSPHPPDAAAVERILDVAAGRIPRCDVLNGWSVHRTAGRLRLVGPPSGHIVGHAAPRQG